jgi:ArsR family metal-binding transcriptional regulator
MAFCGAFKASGGQQSDVREKAEVILTAVRCFWMQFMCQFCGERMPLVFHLRTYLETDLPGLTF